MLLRFKVYKITRYKNKKYCGRERRQWLDGSIAQRLNGSIGMGTVDAVGAMRPVGEIGPIAL